jgi:NADPH2 dehydrogenase
MDARATGGESLRSLKPMKVGPVGVEAVDEVPDWLFTPIVYSNVTFATRVVVAPINVGFARGGRPTREIADFYGARADTSVGLVYVGNVAIDARFASNTGTLTLDDQQSVPAFGQLASSIRERGSAAGIQLAHSPSLSPSRSWRAKSVQHEVSRLRELIGSFSTRDLDGFCDRFVVAAELARLANYDVIQLHCAHGYLLSLLLQDEINLRVDQYGSEGDGIDRLIARVRAATEGSLLSVRLSITTGLRDPGADVALCRDLWRRLRNLGVDVLDVSAGLYTVDRRLIYPNRGDGSIPYWNVAVHMAADDGGLVSVAGNITDVRRLPKAAPNNLMVGISRAFIADSEFAQKSKDGRFHEIRECARTGHCHYFSRGRSHIECGVNPDLGNELRRARS